MNTSSCWLTTSSVTTNGNEHSIIGAHCAGLLQQVCNQTDTYTLGTLTAGLHTVHYDMFYGNLASGQSQCNSFIFGDSLSYSFNVANAAGNLPVQIHPQGTQQICEGDSFLLLTDEEAFATYQWLLNGVPILNANSATHWAKDSGYYQVKMYANGDSGTSVSILIKAFSAPSDQLFQFGNTIETDFDAISYQWYNLQSGQISGAMDSIYEVSSTGEYFVELENQLGCIGYSDTLYVELIEATITPPSPSEACLSDTLKLSASPNGSQYSYQWYRDGIILNGQINNKYSPFLSGDYSVVVSISQSKDTSEAHSVIILPSPTPTISFDGANLFSTPAVSYQWYLVGSGEISGATDSLYTPTLTGVYEVEVTDNNGCKGKSSGFAITAVGLLKSNYSLYWKVHQNEDVLVIRSDNNPNSTYLIFDITGRQIGQWESINDPLEISISNWSSGIYFIQKQGPDSETKKTVIH